MRNELRLAALAKLVTAKSESVEQRLGQEMALAEQTLAAGTDYEELVGALKTVAVLTPKFHAVVIPVLTRFVESIAQRTLTIDGEPIKESGLRFRSPGHLVQEAIDATSPVRYLHTVALVDFLLPLSRSTDDEVAGKARRAFESLIEFDLNVFYGEHGLGAQPQNDIVARLGRMPDAELVANADLILSGLRRVLAPSIEGHSWTYQAITISRGAVTSNGGMDTVRSAAIALLKRMYPLSESVSYRKTVLDALGEAARRERATADEPTATMFERDALEVLAFLKGLVTTEALPVVQAIEHRAFWNFYHAATTTIASAALEVRDALEQQGEYQIYKQLIGFEGIFGQWELLKQSKDAWEYSDAKRREFARKCAEEIDDVSEPLWRARILAFSETRSDDLASFPVYYEFLDLLGQSRPQLALELLTDHEEAMAPFQIALMAGLWRGAKAVELAAVANRWIEEGSHLSVIARSLIKGGQQRQHLLAAALDKAEALGDHDVVIQAMGTAAVLTSEGVEEAKTVFLRGLRVLARSGNANWPRAIWFNRDFKRLIETMAKSEREEVLRSLASLPMLDYQSEEVVAAVCAHEGASVLDFFLGRLKHESAMYRQRRDVDVFDEGAYEAIPNHLNRLHKMLAEEPRALVHALRATFDDEDRSMFPYRGGGRLLEAVFPNFAEPLPSLLQELVAPADPKDIDFALGVLRVFGGSAPILETAKAIIKIVPEQSPAWNELAASLEATGVVMGEYGMAQAFERKRQEMRAWEGDADARVRAFAAWLTSSLDRLIAWEHQRTTESIELRKYKYGAGSEDA